MNATPPQNSTPTSASSFADEPHIAAVKRVYAAGERALVLGRGGAAGNAW